MTTSFGFTKVEKLTIKNWTFLGDWSGWKLKVRFCSQDSGIMKSLLFEGRAETYLNIYTALNMKQLLFSSFFLLFTFLVLLFCLRDAMTLMLLDVLNKTELSNLHAFKTKAGSHWRYWVLRNVKHQHTTLQSYFQNGGAKLIFERIFEVLYASVCRFFWKAVGTIKVGMKPSIKYEKHRPGTCSSATLLCVTIR